MSHLITIGCILGDKRLLVINWLTQIRDWECINVYGTSNYGKFFLKVQVFLWLRVRAFCIQKQYKCSELFKSLKKVKKIGYDTRTSLIMHLIYPPPPPPPAKFCIRIVFNFSWDSCNTQDKWKTKVMQNLGEKIKCIMGDVQVAYGKFVLRFYSVESSWVWTVILQLSWRFLVILCYWTVLFDDVTHF